MKALYSRRKALAFAPKSLLFGAGIATGTTGLSLLGGTANALGVPSYSSVEFEILGNGQRIGQFTGRFQGNAAGLYTATTAVSITSDIYSVDATNVETWNSGTLARLTGQGTDNGKAFAFDISSQGDAMVGSNAQGERVRSRQTSIPTTYWNKEFRRATRVINTLEGNDFDVAATELGTSEIDTAFGTYRVNKVRVRGRGLGLYNVVLSYDGRDEWTGLEFSIFGFDVVYRRIA